jgi:hypothetical protein
MAEEGVVEAAIVTGRFNRPGCRRFLHDQDGSTVATRIFADSAGVGFGEKTALGAQAHRLAQSGEHCRKGVELARVDGQKMLRQTQRSPRADPGEALEVLQ